MTLTIDLTPTEEGRLTALARQAGLDPLDAARKLFSDSLSSEQEARLVTEYHALVDQERQGRLAPEEAAQRHQVEAELDALEAQNPKEREMDRRIQETGGKLDEVLELLRRLPKTGAETQDARTPSLAK